MTLRPALPLLLLFAACTPPEPPALQVNKQAVRFGAVEVNAGAFRQTVALTNIGGGLLRLTSVRLETTSAELELISPATEALEAGQRTTLVIAYRPVVEGDVTGTLHLETNDGQGPRSLEITGRAGTLGASLDVAPDALCGITPGSLDFGTVTSGAAVQRQFTVTSTGSAPITLLGSTLTPSDTGFVVSGPFGEALEPGRVATFTVSYDPLTPGPQAVAVSLSTTSVVQPKLVVSLCGTGLVARVCVTPRELDLGTVGEGFDRTIPLVVSSCGNLPVNVTAVSLVNTNSVPGFTLPVLPVFPRALAENDSFELPVRFDSVVGGLASRRVVRIETSSPVTPTLDVPVGANLPPPCRVSITPNPVSFFNIVPAAPVRLTNLGSKDCVIQRVGITQSRGAFSLERSIETPAILPGNASMEIPIRYSPGAAAETATLEIELDFVRSVTLKGDPTPPPGCRLLTFSKTVDFGLATPDQTARATVVLRNAGLDTCELSSAASDDPTLTVDLSEQQIASLSVALLDVTYRPPSTPKSSISGNVTITSNDLTRSELVLPVSTAHVYCDATCNCGEGETLAHWRFSPISVSSSVTPAGTTPAIRRSCEPSSCGGGQVLLEIDRGTLACVTTPPDCGSDGLDYSEGRWQCVPCELIVQFGGLFDGQRTCAPRPNISCAGGSAPTFDAVTHTWDCVTTCNNGLYDQRMLDGQLVCVPC